MARKKSKIIVASEDDVTRYAPGTEADESNPSAQSDGPSSEAGSDAREPGSTEPGSAEAAEETVESLRAQLQECQDKLLRSQAECANISKRLHQHHAESLRLAGMDLARGLLPVVDSFELTLSSLDKSKADDAVVQGIKLIAGQLTKVLEDHGVQPIEAVGKQFDPTLHEAMMPDQESDLPAGSVTRELQRGYKMKGRVLRAARVAVAAEPEESGEGIEASPDVDRG